MYFDMKVESKEFINYLQKFDQVPNWQTYSILSKIFSLEGNSKAVL